MFTCIATVCLSGNMAEKLEAIAQAGFRAVEIFETDLIVFPGSPADVRRMAADLGLRIVTCQPFRDFEGMPAAKRQRTFDRAERKFDLLQELGTDLMFVCSSVMSDAEGGIDRLAADFAELGERAARRGLRVGYEALSWGKHISDYRDAWEVVRRAGRDNVGIVLDSFHIEALGIDKRPIMSIPGDRIFLVQMADAPRMQMDLLTWARHWRCMPGQGEFDMTGFIDAIETTGYRGPLSLEIFNDRFRAGIAGSVALDGHRSLRWLLDGASHRRGRAVAGATPMPAAAEVKGVAFIEFAVASADRAGFAGLLVAMGFCEVAVHRSKAVSLFAQGDIRIVVNSEKSGFAHSYQLTHGTSVCAIALKVGDAPGTVARATALLDTPHEVTHGPGEADIPAVRGLGGSLLYFIDEGERLSRWTEVDFVPTGAAAVDAGLLSVDHVSQTMQYEEMLTWLLFYTSLFTMRKTPSQAVMDPGGVVQSQVVESGLGEAAGGLRLVLNGSQSHRTLSGRFVTDFFGSGVQHIALRTGDIRRTMRRMLSEGVQMLHIPENYYDDLETRTDLGMAEIAELKALNILYDRDQFGSFLQAYTMPLDGGFFFEFVQRDGYAGYGAANAGVRLAAQARLARPAGFPSR